MNVEPQYGLIAGVYMSIYDGILFQPTGIVDVDRSKDHIRNTTTTITCAFNATQHRGNK